MFNELSKNNTVFVKQRNTLEVIVFFNILFFKDGC